MREQVLFAAISLVLAVSSTACSKSIQDKPMPMSQKNVEKCADKIKDAMKSIAPSPSQDRAELQLGVYKAVIENKMGFSFDKTLRSVMLFSREWKSMGPDSREWESMRLMEQPIYTVTVKPKMALDKGFISQRTFDILDAQAKAHGHLMDEKDEEFLGFVTECQDKNNGACSPKLLLTVPAAHKVFDESADVSERYYELEKKYNIPGLAEVNLIIKPDGQGIDRFAWAFIDEVKFVVNKNLVDLSRRYTKMVAEEKNALSQ